jgi:hypothetical protein
MNLNQILALPTRQKFASHVVEVTPAIAAEWLKRNNNNRSVKRHHLAGLIRDMMAGNWLLTGDPIRFNIHGVLIDGQHRLMAIVQSGVAQTMTVAVGLSETAHHGIDLNARRTVADVLVMGGAKHTACTAAAARLALAARSGLTNTKKVQFTQPEVLEFLDQNPIMAAAAEVATKLHRTIDCPPSVLAVAWAEMSQIDPDACSDFFNSLAASRTDGDGDPRAAYLRRLQHARRQRERIQPLTHLAMLVRTWNAVRRNESLHVLKVRGGTPIPAAAA